MYTVRVVDIKKEHHLDTNSDFLDVSVEIIDGEGEVVSEQKHAFSPDIDKEELTGHIQKILDGYVLEQEQKAANAEGEKLNQHVEELKEELVGSEFSDKE